jgi:hypothetical protein
MTNPKSEKSSQRRKDAKKSEIRNPKSAIRNPVVSVVFAHFALMDFIFLTKVGGF